MQRIFIDMDGVLAEFNHVDMVETLYEKGYFAKLKRIDPVVAAVKELVKGDRKEVYILSAYLSDSKYALKEKNEWLDKNLPEIPSSARIFLPCGISKLVWLKDKGYEIEKSDVLLDDYSNNLHEWEKSGSGIKLLNGINGTRGTWKGKCVSIEDPDLLGSLLFGIEACTDDKEKTSYRAFEKKQDEMEV